MLNYLISFEAFQINFLHLDKHFENSFHKPRFDSNGIQSFHKYPNDAIMSQYTIHFTRAYIHRRKIEFTISDYVSTRQETFVTLYQRIRRNDAISRKTLVWEKLYLVATVHFKSENLGAVVWNFVRYEHVNYEHWLACNPTKKHHEIRLIYRIKFWNY